MSRLKANATFATRVCVIYIGVIFWEMATTPAVSHSNTWQGVPISLLAVPAGAVWLSQVRKPASWCFVYGVGAAPLFLFRFLNMDRFPLWLMYSAPPNEVILLCWVLFAFSLGFASWFAASVLSLKAA